MKCNDCDKLLTMRLTGDLSPDDRGRLAGHLQDCAACTARSEEYDGLSEGLSSLHDVYSRQRAPFVFRPDQSADEDDSASRRVFVLTRAALMTAAVIALVFVLQPDKIGHEPQTPRSSNEVDSAVFVEATGQSGIWRTPVLWPGMGQEEQRSQSAPVRIPKLPTLARRPYGGLSPTRFVTPSLVTQQRRILRHDRPQSYRDHRNALPRPDAPQSLLG